MKFKIEEFIRKHLKSVIYSGNGENLSEYNTGRKGHNGTPCTDHLGNKFDSYTDMCNYHGVDVDILNCSSFNVSLNCSLVATL